MAVLLGVLQVNDQYSEGRPRFDSVTILAASVPGLLNATQEGKIPEAKANYRGFYSSRSV